MISQETAAAIWNAYREIATAEKLLVDYAKVLERRDAYITQMTTLGESIVSRGVKIGVPDVGQESQFVDVSPDIVRDAIQRHIERQRVFLVKLNEQARVELAADAVGGTETAESVDLPRKIVDTLGLSSKSYERFAETMGNDPVFPWENIGFQRQAAWRAAVILAVEAALRHAGVA